MGIFRFACAEKGSHEKLVLANIYQSIVHCHKKKKKEEQHSHKCICFTHHGYLLLSINLDSKLRYWITSRCTLDLSITELLYI